MQSGGFQKEIDFNKVINLTSSYRKNMDCCPCTFRYLDLISDDIFNTLLQQYGETGMYQGMILEFFKEKYSKHSEDYRFLIEEADIRNKSRKEVIDVVHNLFKYIKKGYGIIGGITRMNDTSHCIIFFRNLKGDPYILDAQSNEVYAGKGSIGKTFQHLFQENNIIKMFYLIAYNEKDKKVLILDKENISIWYEDAIEGPDYLEEDPNDIFEDAIKEEPTKNGGKGRKKKRTKKKTKKKTKKRTKRKTKKRRKKRRKKRKRTKKNI